MSVLDKNPSNRGKMDLTVGDTLVLKAAAVDLDKFNPADPSNPEAILYPAGTEARIERMYDGKLDLRFPSGEILPHTLLDALYYFNRKTPDGAFIFTKNSTGLGTPPRELGKYLPAEADWKRNYRWKVTIELEDRGLKVAMCGNCYEDIGENAERDNKGLSKCKSCGIFVVPIDPTKVEYPKEQNEGKKQPGPLS